jgi:hypothetical protein
MTAACDRRLPRCIGLLKTTHNAKTGLDETFQKLSLLNISLSDTSLSGCSSDFSMAGLP